MRCLLLVILWLLQLLAESQLPLFHNITIKKILDPTTPRDKVIKTIPNYHKPAAIPSIVALDTHLNFTLNISIDFGTPLDVLNTEIIVTFFMDTNDSISTLQKQPVSVQLQILLFEDNPLIEVVPFNMTKKFVQENPEKGLHIDNSNYFIFVSSFQNSNNLAEFLMPPALVQDDGQKRLYTALLKVIEKKYEATDGWIAGSFVIIDRGLISQCSIDKVVRQNLTEIRDETINQTVRQNISFVDKYIPQKTALLYGVSTLHDRTIRFNVTGFEGFFEKGNISLIVIPLDMECISKYTQRYVVQAAKEEVTVTHNKTFKGLLIAAAVIFSLLVSGLIIFFVVKYLKSKKGESVKQQCIIIEGQQGELMEDINFDALQSTRTESVIKALCIMCSSQESNILLEPCRHSQFCVECILSLQRKSTKQGKTMTCPTCDAFVKKVKKCP